MAGIYIHIPFCRQKCHYCNFFSIASLKKKDDLIASLFQEIELQQNYLGKETVETIYFGGGTPSLADAETIDRLIDEIAKYHNIGTNPEITLEANPDDLTWKKTKAMGKTQINRLSIGIQSFFDSDLQYLHRIHTAGEALTAIKIARDCGFSNLSIDLIYGIPTLTSENWIRNLETFLSLKILHLSAYALTVEPKTALDILIRKKKMIPVSEELQVLHFNQLAETMGKNGFVQYEISNFCIEPHFSRHNRSYWQGKKYLGLGPSAHSYNLISRQWNCSSISEYIETINNGQVPAEWEILPNEQRYNEYVLTSLRTMWGTDENVLASEFGGSFTHQFKTTVANFLRNETIIKTGTRYILTHKGKLLADRIVSDLFTEIKE